jgi:hypothetical protein
MLEVVHVEYGFRRLDDAPDNDRGDFDRVAILVVDLEFAAFKVAHAQRDATPSGERIHPPESRLLDRSFVDSEQLNNLGFVGVDDRESIEADQVHDNTTIAPPIPYPLPL